MQLAMLRIGPAVAARRSLVLRWRKQASVGLVGLCLLAGLPQPAHAQAEPPSESSATTTWQQLRAEASQKLQTADDRLEAADEVRDALEAFARDHEGTQEAVLALVNHGMLSTQLGDREAAERSLEQALEDADDEQLNAMIRMHLRQLGMEPGEVPPAFSTTTLDGQQISLDDFEGKVVLLDFWATWCAPCIAELPNLQQVYREHREAGFEIISISLDEDKQALERFLDQREMSWTHVFNASMPEGEDLASAYGVTAIPQMILVGRDGRIAVVNTRGPALDAAVEEALREEQAEPASNSEPNEHEPEAGRQSPPGDDT